MKTKIRKKNHREDPPTCPPPNFLLPTMPLAQTRPHNFWPLTFARWFSLAIAPLGSPPTPRPPAPRPPTPRRLRQSFRWGRRRRGPALVWPEGAPTARRAASEPSWLGGRAFLVARAMGGCLGHACMMRCVLSLASEPLFLKPIVNSDPECSLLFYFSIS